MAIEIAKFSVEGRDVVSNPELAIAALRDSRADLFTFLQKLPEISPQDPYRFEWDNLAVLPISTFVHRWSQQIGFKARNKAKQAEKKGVVREVRFGSVPVPGIGNSTVPQQEGGTRT